MEDKDYFGNDKVRHFFVCFIIAVYSTECAIVAALTKEYVDGKNPNNHACILDLLADLLGIIVGTALRFILIMRWNWIV